MAEHFLTLEGNRKFSDRPIDLKIGQDLYCTILNEVIKFRGNQINEKLMIKNLMSGGGHIDPPGPE